MCWLQQSTQLWSLPTFLLVPLMVMGAIECLIGYRAWRFLLAVNGTALGIVAGAMICMLLQAPMLILIGVFVGGFAGAMLFVRVARLGTFIFALGSTASLTVFLAHVAAAPPHVIAPISALTGLAGAIAATARCRCFMIGLAAVAGAQQVASAWRAHQIPPDGLPLPEVITGPESAIFLAFAAAGLLLQLLTSPIKPNQITSSSDARESADDKVAAAA
jgi:hypothetical protein